MVNVLTLGVNYFYQSFNDADTGYNPIGLGLNTGATSPVLIGSPKLTITGFDYVGATSPEARTDTTGHLTDTLSYTAGDTPLSLAESFAAPYWMSATISTNGVRLPSTVPEGRGPPTRRLPAI